MIGIHTDKKKKGSNMFQSLYLFIQLRLYFSTLLIRNRSFTSLLNMIMSYLIIIVMYSLFNLNISDYLRIPYYMRTAVSFYRGYSKRQALKYPHFFLLGLPLMEGTVDHQFPLQFMSLMQ